MNPVQWTFIIVFSLIAIVGYWKIGVILTIKGWNAETAKEGLEGQLSNGAVAVLAFVWPLNFSIWGLAYKSMPHRQNRTSYIQRVQAEELRKVRERRRKMVR